MGNIKYDSIYKFIVSIGIILVALPWFVIYYIFNNNEVVLVNTEELLKLTEVSAEIIKIKQNAIYSIINNYKIIIIIGFIFEIIGFFMIIKGMTSWNRNVQKIENEKRELEIRKLEKEIEQISFEEKKNMINNEIKVIESKIPLQDYLEVENQIIDKIEEVFDNNTVLRDVKINDFISCLIPYNNPNNLLAKAFEIKYIRNTKITRNYLIKVEEEMEKFAESYYNKFRQFCYITTLFIVEDFERFIIENKSLVNKIEEYNSILHSNSQICKIVIADTSNVKEKLESVRDGKQIVY